MLVVKVSRVLIWVVLRPILPFKLFKVLKSGFISKPLAPTVPPLNILRKTLPISSIPIFVLNATLFAAFERNGIDGPFIEYILFIPP